MAREQYSIRMIALLLYEDDREQYQNRVWAHISKVRKAIRGCDHGFGCENPEQNLRNPEKQLQPNASASFTNKNRNFDAATTTRNLEPQLNGR